MMERDLNLKRKDFVFVDDRADQQAMVADKYPEIRSLDATDRHTWDCFGLWRDMLMSGSDMDRIKMYQDRCEREKFTYSSADTSDEAAMFGELGLRLKLWEAQKTYLPRVTELINRTTSSI